MSRKVANALKTRVEQTGGDITKAVAIITVGTNFPDAIAVSPLACRNLWPILLTNRADGSALHESALAALSDLGITRAIKVGTYATLPGTVAGLANTFEANIRWSVSAADGSPLDQGFTLATAGNGTWGSFSFAVNLVDYRGDATLRVWEDDMSTGEARNTAEIPIVIR